MKYFTVDSKSLELEITDKPKPGMAIPVNKTSPMWDVVLFHFMYPTVYRKQEGPIRVRYSLAPPPPWLVAIAGVMWEGILQGAAWDVVKAALHAALDKLRTGGLLPVSTATSGRQSSEREIRAGWVAYSEPGRKQFEMFLTLKKNVTELPERHALAYARARNDAELGQIIRGETKKPSGRSHSGRDAKEIRSKKGKTRAAN